MTGETGLYMGAPVSWTATSRHDSGIWTYPAQTVTPQRNYSPGAVLPATGHGELADTQAEPPLMVAVQSLLCGGLEFLVDFEAAGIPRDRKWHWVHQPRRDARLQPGGQTVG